MVSVVIMLWIFIPTEISNKGMLCEVVGCVDAVTFQCPVVSSCACLTSAGHHPMLPGVKYKTKTHKTHWLTVCVYVYIVHNGFVLNIVNQFLCAFVWQCDQIIANKSLKPMQTTCSHSQVIKYRRFLVPLCIWYTCKSQPLATYTVWPCASHIGTGPYSVFSK